MKKSHQFLVNFFALILINFIFYQSTHYPKHIYGGVMELSVLSIIFNLLFFLINAIFLIAIFERNNTVFLAKIFDFNDKSNTKRFFVKIALLLILQIICDVVVLQLNKLPFIYRYSLTDILIVLQWLTIYSILVPKAYRLWENKMVLTVTSVMLILELSATIIFNITKNCEYNAILNKYQETSPYAVQTLKNIDFLCNIKEFILDCVTTLTLLLARILKTEDSSNKKKDLSEDEWIKKENIRLKSPMRVYSQLFITSFILSFCLLLRAALLPASTFFASDGVKSESISGATNLSHIESVKNIYRGDNGDHLKALYSIDTFILSKDDVIEEFIFASSKPNVVFIDGEYNISDSIKYEFEGQEVFLYGNYAISFFENGTLEIVRIEELNEYDEKGIITQLLKKLLSDGNVFAFEYGCEYLIKYDYDFIKPYIDRYVLGIFTDDEIKWMEESTYRKQYIVDIAKSIIN